MYMLKSIFNRKVGDTSTADFSFSNSHLVPLIIGVVLATVGFVDMVVLFLVPFLKIMNTKKKYPTEIFEKPNIPIIIIHFILHLLIIFLGIILILISLNKYLPNEKLWIMIPLIFIVALWIVQMGLCFSFTKYPKSQMTIDDLATILHKNNPSNLIFIYTHYKYEKRTCTSGKKRKCTTHTYHCYSKSGISIPIQTNLIQNSFDFSDAPSLFYINVQQDANMTNKLSQIYEKTLNSVNGCDSHDKEIEYHPIIVGNYIVSRNKVPFTLTKQSRMASILFGVGVFYELYSKSVPRIGYIQKFNADVISSHNYEDDLAKFSCQQYGTCSTDYERPTP